MLRTILGPSQGNNGVPKGGAEGQVLVKKTDANGDVEWSNDPQIITESSISDSTRPVNSYAVAKAVQAAISWEYI